MFTVINESFTCLACGKEIPPASSTCRNHCPYCLTSVHVDDQPGDRAAGCGGLMLAFDYEGDHPPDITLVFRCQRCGMVKRNRALLKDRERPDSWDAILALRKPVRG